MVAKRSLRDFEPQEYPVGTDGTIPISLYDSTGTALGVVGASASWKLYKANLAGRIRDKPFKDSAVLTKTSAASQITLATGLATVTIADTDLANKRGDYWMVLHITDSGGNVTHLGQGPLHLRASAA